MLLCCDTLGQVQAPAPVYVVSHVCFCLQPETTPSSRGGADGGKHGPHAGTHNHKRGCANANAHIPLSVPHRLSSGTASLSPTENTCAAIRNHCISYIHNDGGPNCWRGSRLVQFAAAIGAFHLCSFAGGPYQVRKLVYRNRSTKCVNNSGFEVVVPAVAPARASVLSCRNYNMVVSDIGLRSSGAS